jgi:hypothetical protein
MARRRTRIERGPAATAFPTEGEVSTLDTNNQNQIDRITETNDSDLTEDEIARRAYERFQERGGVHGHDQEDWYEAEREIRSGRSRDE